jgi:hypothetical protein
VAAELLKAFLRVAMPLLIDGNYPQAHTPRGRPVEPGTVWVPLPPGLDRDVTRHPVRYPKMDLSSWRERFP